MRIVCLVDVDDVLNFCGSARERKRLWFHNGWIRRTAHLTRGTYKLLLNPEHGRWLRELTGTPVKLAWGSTWQDDANTWVGSPLGLPTLLVAPVTDEENKWKSVIPWAAENYDAVAWLEDQGPELYGAKCLLDCKYPGTPYKLVRVNEKLGLTIQDVTEVRDWARKLLYGQE